MSEEYSGAEQPGSPLIWALLRQIVEDPTPAVRLLGSLIYHLTYGQGRRWVRLSYAKIQDASGLTPRRARPCLEYMQRRAMIERRRLGGRPGEKPGDSRGDEFRLALYAVDVHDTEEEAAPTRAGPINKRLGEVTSPPEPQGAFGSPDKEPEASTTDQP